MFDILKKFTKPSILKAKGILGMNARNYDIIGHNNKRRLYPLVDDKVQTKILANKAGITTPSLIGIIEYRDNEATLKFINENVYYIDI